MNKNIIVVCSFASNPIVTQTHVHCLVLVSHFSWFFFFFFVMFLPFPFAIYFISLIIHRLWTQFRFLFKVTNFPLLFSSRLVIVRFASFFLGETIEMKLWMMRSEITTQHLRLEHWKNSFSFFICYQSTIERLYHGHTYWMPTSYLLPFAPVLDCIHIMLTLYRTYDLHIMFHLYIDNNNKQNHWLLHWNLPWSDGVSLNGCICSMNLRFKSFEIICNHYTGDNSR